MRLEMLRYPITSVAWGDSTSYRNGTLTVSREGLMGHLGASGVLKDLAEVELALVAPGTSTRVINIFDVVAARARLGEGTGDYPGVCNPLQPVGNGSTAELANFGVLALSTLPDMYNKILDMSGAGAELTPHADWFHLAVQATPRTADLPRSAYWRDLKRLALQAGVYLASEAAASASPDSIRVYSLDPRPVGLPKAAYICMMASHQKAEAGEPILYGDDIQGFLPTVLHPNELLDGAVIAPFWNLGIDTHSFQANPVVDSLYARHGREVDFRGVVVNVAHVTQERRERSVLMTANLVAEILEADLAVITKVGGGIPESDLMMTVEALEKRGVKTSAVLWSHMGDGTIEESLSAHSSAADAIASVGIYDAPVELGPQDRVVGGRQVGPFTSDPREKPVPAEGPLRPLIRDISGAISQVGASRVAMVEV